MVDDLSIALFSQYKNLHITFRTEYIFVLSAEAVEYTDCISAEG